MNSSAQIKKNIEKINFRIDNAAKVSSRKQEDITLVSVTKSFPNAIWNTAIKNNLFTIAENRINETEEKYLHCKQRNKLKLHLIGHLQSNKAKNAIKMFDVIETVDSIKLASKLNKEAYQKEKIQTIYVQINTGKDPNKFGFDVDRVLEKIILISQMKNLKLKGIMTIPPRFVSEIQLRNIFKKTREIRDNVYNNVDSFCKDLSMGMSNDFDIAIEEGATHVRIGTAIFGVRD